MVLTGSAVQDDAALLVRDLRCKGRQLDVRDGRLHISGDPLADAERAGIIGNRDAICAFLASEEALRRIPRRAQRDPMLSPEQERIWFLSQLESSLESFVIPIALSIDGPIDAEKLDAAFRMLVEHHDQLRLKITVGPAMSATADRLALDQFRLSAHRVADDGYDALFAEAARCGGRKITLDGGPLIHVDLVSNGTRSIIVIGVHHLICDGWSARLICRDLAAFYAVNQGNEARRPRAPQIDYGDFATWQQALLDSPVGNAQLAYWQRFAQAAPDLLRLPADRPRPMSPSFQSGRHEVCVDAAIVARLEAIGRTQCTLFSRLSAAWGLFLGRFCNVDRLALGFPIAGRTRRETQEVVGLFSRMVAVAIELDRDLSFASHLSRVDSDILAAQERQDVPIEVAARGMRRDAGLSPLFNVCINMLPQGGHARTMNDGFDAERIDLGLASTQLFDMSLVCWQLDGHLFLSFEYASDLFDAATITTLADHFLVFLRGVVDRPDDPVGLLPLQSERELQKVVELGRGPSMHCAGTLDSLIADQIARTPDSPAIILGNAQMNYAALGARARSIAASLTAMGVGRDVPVGICLPRGFDLIVAIVGVIMAGGCYLPIDPAYPTDRRLFMLSDSGASVVVTTEALAAVLPKGVTALNIAELMSNSDATLPWAPPSVDPADLAYIIYTSGSTGRPKGVMIEHRNIVNHSLWLNDALGLGRDDRVLQRTSTSFDASVWEVFSTLTSGAAIVLAPADGGNDPNIIGQTLRDSGVTVMQCVPSFLDLLLDAGELDAATCLRIVCNGGEPLSPGLARRLAAACTARHINLYGPTETTIDALFADVDATMDVIPIGRAVANTDVLIVDAAGTPCPVGVPGELLIAGGGVGRGYLGRPDLTTASFVPHPLEKDRIAYRSGDLARWTAHGDVECLGRVDKQVKLRGFRIEPGEIEAILMAHPQIAKAVVAVREDPGGSRLVAYIVANEEAPDAERLRKRLRARLPDYMVPSAFVVIDALPTLPNGKLDYSALPMPQRVLEGREFVAPRTPMETRLAALLADVLGLDRVGVTDSLFELGGDSLTAARFGAAIAKTLGRKIPLSNLLSHPTVADLADLFEHGHDKPSDFAISLKAAPAPSDHAILFMPTMLGHGSLYAGLAARLKTDGDVLTCRLPGTEPGEATLASLSDIAEHCIAHMVDHNRHRRWSLVGWSFGGIVAHEVARQLDAKGHIVNAVVLLDAYRHTSTSGPRVALPMLLEHMLRNQLGAEGLAAIDVEATSALYNASRQAVSGYGHYGTATASRSLVDIRAEESAARVSAGELVPIGDGPRRIEILPGSHFSVLAPPNRDRLASMLNQILADLLPVPA